MTPTQPSNRRSIRLAGYDYTAAGAYFVTICAHNRECLFGEVVDGAMMLNDAGRIIADEWENTAMIRQEIELDGWVVMPNHLHGIVMITDIINAGSPAPIVGAHGRAPLHRAPKSLGSLIAGFKSAVTKRINELRKYPGVPVWQRNYYERIIRNEAELIDTRDYIHNNPAQWALDRFHP